MFEFCYGDLDLAHRYEEVPVTKPDFAKHYHDFYELLYFASGECDFVMEDVRCRLGAGDVVSYCPANITTSITAHRPTDRPARAGRSNSATPPFPRSSFHGSAKRISSTPYPTA